MSGVLVGLLIQMGAKFSHFSPPLLHPGPDSPQAASPEDQWASCPHFSETEPPSQAKAKDDFLKGKASQTKEIITLNRGAIKTANESNKTFTLFFMGLKTTPVANQDALPEVSTDSWPDLMTTTQKQENQTINLETPTNERTPSQGAILLPLNLGVLATWPYIF
ncbi:hypothetical protein DSO57_1034818 [Entomophthora muscae]|uniref:Uncharacterized protein n=1 Tax=Entomophthora muscae TaxID=34485 RepID=A0ACC2U8P9_9FUNG|nr:hypothetical protein DSO57_1034818 [Entomophthora muscae]